MTIVGDLADRGTRSIILTGGEPLLRDDLADICRCAKERQLRVTLSTSGIALPISGPDVLPFVDELGLPLDGADEERNNALRYSRGKLNHFRAFMEAIKFTRQHFSEIEITIRTVVSKQNEDHVIDIGQLLQELGIDGLRWKLYQFAPLGYGKDVRDAFWIETSCFHAIVHDIRTTYPDLYIDTLDHDARDGRYLHILPNGAAMTPTRAHEELHLGNALENLDNVLRKLAESLDVAQNGRHGCPKHDDRADLAIEVHRAEPTIEVNGTSSQPHLPHV
jgi:MoaA/NifB/PqqE/SkfB family radical SAM enzyme